MPIIISLQNVLTKLLQKESGAVFLPHSVHTLHHGRPQNIFRRGEALETTPWQKRQSAEGMQDPERGAVPFPIWSMGICFRKQ